MADDFQERTEPASPRRREEARREGQVARSQDVAAVAVLSTALAALALGGRAMLDALHASATRFLGAGAPGLDPSTAGSILALAARDVAVAAGPFALALAAAGAAAHFAQVGPLFTTSPITPNLARIDPAAGFRRLFAVRNLVELAKASVKICAVALVLVLTMRGLAGDLAALAQVPPAALPGAVGKLALGLGTRIVAVLAVLAAADYAFQRFDHERRLRMTREEVKEEIRQTEGDLRTRSRIRARQIELSRNRMLAAVARADVVVTNPVHVAVALRYDPAKMAAPRVVAKGARLFAERIKREARRHGVPVVENPPVARLLFRLVQVGREIPLALYQAVAEILAFVYRTRPGRAPALGRAAGR